MSRNGLLIDYEYCTGCHSCEVACKKELNLPVGKWGIKLAEIGPMQLSPDRWQMDYVPIPTEFCNLCEERVAKGKDPACVHHCLGKAMEYGPVEELAAKMVAKGKKMVLFAP
ncbi:oxidoreductase [Neomoorella humiferrea]|uniref:Hydrogenase 2 protein HybA n=1 Tax=Neomoorella humiferrea TaxID=676965 RepID=A0A2T0AUN8_9FIRM|nr:oxidoreductase [Moorella humiferrea]PRR74218.1 hydrogenase 2 protein HybA [Moorella humiferrea]